MASWTEYLAENGWVPDMLLRRGIRYRLQQILDEYKHLDVEKALEKKMKYVEGLRKAPIAIETATANKQHYEVPTEFFTKVMGKHLKYSSCWYNPDTKTLDDAEANMLNMYCERAQIKDGMELLDLGCGWGSFTLFAAQKFPNCKINSLSNSKTQRMYIEGEAEKKGLKNITVHTGDINLFDTDAFKGKFDRIISVEMFEHMKNYEQLLTKISTWLKPDGFLFIHIFAHKDVAYDFKEGDWMADNFFSGGTMPSADLFTYFQKHLEVVNHWNVNGTHYSKTCEDWLKNMDKNIVEVRKLFAEVYGAQNVVMWVNRWRLFFLACSELF